MCENKGKYLLLLVWVIALSDFFLACYYILAPDEIRVQIKPWVLGITILLFFLFWVIDHKHSKESETIIKEVEE